MSRQTGQTSLTTDSHSHELQLAVSTKRSKALIHKCSPFKIAQYQHQDELNILLNTAKQLKYHYFAVKQQPFLTLPHKASQNSRISFFSYLIEIYGAQFTKGSVVFICDQLNTKFVSLIHDTLFNPLSDKLFEYLNGDRT